MKKVKLVRDCLFTHKDGRQELLPAGQQELPDEVADHWFVQAHTANPPPAAVQAGTPQAAQAAAARIARQRLLDAAEAQEADAAKEEVRSRQRSRKRPDRISDDEAKAQSDDAILADAEQWEGEGQG